MGLCAEGRSFEDGVGGNFDRAVSSGLDWGVSAKGDNFLNGEVPGTGVVGGFTGRNGDGFRSGTCIGVRLNPAVSAC